MNDTTESTDATIEQHVDVRLDWDYVDCDTANCFPTDEDQEHHCGAAADRKIDELAARLPEHLRSELAWDWDADPEGVTIDVAGRRSVVLAALVELYPAQAITDDDLSEYVVDVWNPSEE